MDTETQTEMKTDMQTEMQTDMQTDMEEPVVERKKVRKVFSRMGLAYFLFLAAALLFQIAVGFIARLTGTTGMFDSQNKRVFLSMLSMYGVGFPVFWLLVKNMETGYGDGGLDELERREDWGALPIFLCFLIMIGVMEAGSLIGNVLMTALNHGKDAANLNDVFTLIMESSMGIILLFTVILGPIMEELMFRKILIDRIVRFGEVRAVLVSGILFGLIHGNFYQFFYTFGLGAILAYVYIRTGKIRITIFMHMVINGMSGIIAGSIMKIMEYDKFLEMVTSGDTSGAMTILASHWISYMLLIIYSLLLIIMALAGIVILICVCAQKKIHFLPTVRKIPGRFTYIPVFLNTGMILFFASCVVEFLKL